MDHIDTMKIDYHLSYYRGACHQISLGVDNPKEFARLEAVRDASLCAIALDANIISEIGNGKLDRANWEKAIAWIKRYEASQIDDQSWLDPNCMYDAVDEGLELSQFAQPAQPAR